MESDLLEMFKELIDRETGLRLRTQDMNELQKMLATRLRMLNLTAPDEYYRFLSEGTLKSREEFKELIFLLTVGESYFFRDRGQFDLLRRRILPELIKRRAGEKRLRIWSAGCSTGEEPYSLAILVSELLHDTDGWETTILGTDVRPEFLDRAAKGVYPEWSFRMVDPAVRQMYFTGHNGSWAIDDAIKRLVAFSRSDLLNDAIPSGEMRDMDLIVCRNVFIYYNRAAIVRMVEKFAKTLRNGGFLLTGHGELFSAPPALLKTRMLPESMIYERVDAQESNESGFTAGKAPRQPKTAGALSKASIAAPLKQPPAHIAVKDASEAALAGARALYHGGRYRQAIERLRPILDAGHSSAEALRLAGSCHANIGDREKAHELLQKAIEADRLNCEPYYVLAHLALEDGDAEEAKRHFRKALYLNPGFVPAYIELAAIYEGEKDEARAMKMLSSAFEELKSMPPDARIEPYENTTAAELMEYLRKMTAGAQAGG